MSRKLGVALVGLGFGGSFAPIYRDHPDVRTVGLYDPDRVKTELFSRATGIEKTYASFEEILRDKEIDAVHLVSPIPEHEAQTLAVLYAGKHCACTVPMATTIEGLRRIVQAVNQAGKVYMMMETSVYTRPFFTARRLLREGVIGRVQFLRGCHYQDMRGWPQYWQGLPPMHYGTHALSPLWAFAGAPFSRVHCVGAGTMTSKLTRHYGNPFPIESALLTFANGMQAEATRALFETARPYLEGFYVYGDRASFEWGFEDASEPWLSVARARPTGMRGCDYDIIRLTPDTAAEGLPESIRRYTVGGKFDPTNPQNSLKEGARGGHHGSHPHMVHAFVQAIMDGHRPWMDERTGANITAAGILAHESALRGGEGIDVPDFSEANL